MESASKDVLFSIGLQLDPRSLGRWSKCCSRIHKYVYQNLNLWSNKLLLDYSDYEKIFNNYKSSKDMYIFMYRLRQVSIFDKEADMHKTFNKKEINWCTKELRTLPAFDLPNLHFLELSNNKISFLPVFVMPNLKVLNLSYNELTTIPSLYLPELKF